MKNYLAEMIDLTGDTYINPMNTPYGDGTGLHKRTLGSIKSLSVHHDASPRPHDYDSLARYRQEARAHYDRLGPGLQYHYKIDNVGQIFQTRPLERWLYVVGTAENVSTVAVCLDGYFHPDVNQIPTREQYEALAQLVIYLCTQRPDIPDLLFPDVRPHSDYTATACCGDLLRPYVLGINDEVSALAIPTNAVYDWPSLQIMTTHLDPPVEVPVVVPTWIQDGNFLPATYVSQVNTYLDGLATGKRYADYTPGEKFDLVARFTKDGEEPRLLTAYGIDLAAKGKRELAGLPQKDLLPAQNPTATPTPPSIETPAPSAPPVTAPPAQSQAEQDHEKRISALESSVASILAFIKSIFNWKG